MGEMGDESLRAKARLNPLLSIIPAKQVEKEPSLAQILHNQLYRETKRANNCFDPSFFDLRPSGPAVSSLVRQAGV
ncbi:MAG: hypothetical protein ACPGWR_03505 [Ardenticatenaceae bacterium]